MNSKSVILSLGLILAAGNALALPPMLKVFETTYVIKEDSKIHKASCGVCHVKAPVLNPYGKQLKTLLDAAKTKTLTPEMLKKIEKLDSDKDGVVNLAEIKADSLPGDPASKPAGNTKKIKHKK